MRWPALTRLFSSQQVLAAEVDALRAEVAALRGLLDGVYDGQVDEVSATDVTATDVTATDVTATDVTANSFIFTPIGSYWKEFDNDLDGVLDELSLWDSFDGRVLAFHDSSASGNIDLLVFHIGEIQFQDGTVGDPSLQFEDDPDTGLYRYGADKIGVSAGGGITQRINGRGENLVLYRSGTASSPSSACYISVRGHSDDSRAFWMGYGDGSTTTFRIHNDITSGDVIVSVKDSGGTNRDRVKVLANGAVEVRDSGGAVRFQVTSTGFDVWDNDDSVLRSMSFGADDSGGSGYKVLRVPN